MVEVEELKRRLVRVEEDLGALIRLIAKGTPEEEIRRVLEPITSSKYANLLADNLVKKCGWAYFIESIARRIEAAKKGGDITKKEAYTKIYELSDSLRTITIDEVYRIVMPKDLLRIAIARQGKSQVTDLTFYPYDQEINGPSGIIRYISLYDSPLEQIHSEGRNISEEGAGNANKRRYGLPKALAEDIFKGGDRVIFVGMHDNVGVFRFVDYKENKRFIRDTSAFVCLFNK